MKARILKRTVVGGKRVGPSPKMREGKPVLDKQGEPVLDDAPVIEISEQDLRYLFVRKMAEPVDKEAKEVCNVSDDKAS